MINYEDGVLLIRRILMENPSIVSYLNCSPWWLLGSCKVVTKSANADDKYETQFSCWLSWRRLCI